MSLDSHTASGQALGYFYQLERAMSWLATSPMGTIVGIETEDDVVIQLSNGEKIFEQDKSSTTTHPFLPSRPDLWKTLNIWLEAIDSGEIDLNKTNFYLVTNKSHSNSLAEKIGKAKLPHEVENCFSELKDVAKTINSDVSELIKKVFSHDENLIKLVIAKTTYSGGENVCGDDYRRKLISDLQIPNDDDPEATDVIINNCSGWLFTTIIDLWKNKQPAFIERDAFIRIKTAITSHLRQQFINQKIIEVAEITSEIQNTHFNCSFVKQLRLININEDAIRQSISDYINSLSNKTKLARKGYVTSTQIDEMNDDLKRRWRGIYETNKIRQMGLSDHELGTLIYYDTLGYKAKLDGVEINNAFFTPGCYHCLADDLEVGWHPNFEILLSNNQ